MPGRAGGPRRIAAVARIRNRSIRPSRPNSTAAATSAADTSSAPGGRLTPSPPAPEQLAAAAHQDDQEEHDRTAARGSPSHRPQRGPAASGCTRRRDAGLTHLRRHQIPPSAGPLCFGAKVCDGTVPLSRMSGSSSPRSSAGPVGALVGRRLCFLSRFVLSRHLLDDRWLTHPATASSGSRPRVAEMSRRRNPEGRARRGEAP